MSMHVCRCCGSESEETGHQSEGVIESTVGEEKLGVPPMIEGERMRKREDKQESSRSPSCNSV